jgi:hypothetical protein
LIELRGECDPETHMCRVQIAELSYEMTDFGTYEKQLKSIFSSIKHNLTSSIILQIPTLLHNPLASLEDPKYFDRILHAMKLISAPGVKCEFFKAAIECKLLTNKGAGSLYLSDLYYLLYENCLKIDNLSEAVEALESHLDLLKKIQIQD